MPFARPVARNSAGQMGAPEGGDLSIYKKAPADTGALELVDREPDQYFATRTRLSIADFALDGTRWDGIYLGRRKGKDLVYAGKVDHGFGKTSAAELRRWWTPSVRQPQPHSKRVAPNASCV